MPGFMADFDADLARPHGVAATGGGLGQFIGQRVVAAGGSTASTTTITVPAGANLCLAQAIGGGGNAYVSNGYYTGPSGGGALGESLLPVQAGLVFTVSSGGSQISQGYSGIPTSISYNGSIVAYGDNGRGAGGPGGMAANCVGNVRSLSGYANCAPAMDSYGNLIVTAVGAYSVPYGYGGGTGNGLGPPGGAGVFYFFRI